MCAHPPPVHVQAYKDSRHHVVYEDGQEDVGIIDGRNLWLFEDDKWTSMRLRWKDDDLHLVINEPSARDKADAEEQRDTVGGEKMASSEAKEDAQNASGWLATSENPAGGFMIGCDMCGTSSLRCCCPDRCQASLLSHTAPAPLRTRGCCAQPT